MLNYVLRFNSKSSMMVRTNLSINSAVHIGTRYTVQTLYMFITNNDGCDIDKS